MTQQPPWNPDDLTASFKTYTDWMLEQVKATFLRDKTHVELFFLVMTDGQVALGAPPPDQPREQVISKIRDAVKMHHIYGVIHVAEAWTYLPKSANDHTYRQILDGEIPVSQLKPEDRTEALTYRIQSRDGVHCLWLHPIQRDEESLRLAAPIVVEGTPGGKFESFF